MPAIWRLHLFKHACQIDSLIVFVFPLSAGSAVQDQPPPSHYNNHGTKVRGGRGTWKKPIRSHTQELRVLPFINHNNNKAVFCGQRREASPSGCRTYSGAAGKTAGNSAASSCSLPTPTTFPASVRPPGPERLGLFFFCLFVVVVCVFSRFIRASNDISNNMLP